MSSVLGETFQVGDELFRNEDVSSTEDNLPIPASPTTVTDNLHTSGDTTALLVAPTSLRFLFARQGGLVTGRQTCLKTLKWKGSNITSGYTNFAFQTINLSIGRVRVEIRQRCQFP